MPTVDVEENIKKLRMNIEQLTQEVFRLQGMLQTFEGFKKGGLTQIELPQDPTEQLESIQEKPE
jgi:lipid II:glycine glycyltransferase (peptidoglycan interpeptide bridge formation enzyme)